MFDLRPMPSPLSPTLTALAREADPATIGHFRLRGFPAPLIRPVVPVPRIAGTVVTLALPGADSTLLHHAAGLIRSGDVLVIDRLGDRHHACLGGGVAATLAQFGLAGVIIDGPAADPQEIRHCGLPVWATGFASITTRILGNGGALNVPVSMGGAVAMPGDLVIADEGGIVILPAEEAEVDIRRAVALQTGERAALPLVSKERPLGELTGASALIRDALQRDSSR